jgi:hypothetical protein
VAALLAFLFTSLVRDHPITSVRIKQKQGPALTRFLLYPFIASHQRLLKYRPAGVKLSGPNPVESQAAQSRQAPNRQTADEVTRRSYHEEQRGGNIAAGVIEQGTHAEGEAKSNAETQESRLIGLTTDNGIERG